MLTETEVTVLSDRRVGAPYGAGGGAPGQPGRNTLIRDGVETALPGKVAAHAGAGRSAAHRNAGRRRLREAPMTGRAA